MISINVTNCRIFRHRVSDVFAAILDFEGYHAWWPLELRLRVMRTIPGFVGSRIEVRPQKKWIGYVCEIAQIQPEREILIRYVQGVHRGTGLWTFKKEAECTRLCYQTDLAPHGWVNRLLSHFTDFTTIHLDTVEGVLSGLEGWLRTRAK